jgi:hypothetical protein
MIWEILEIETEEEELKNTSLFLAMHY